MKEAGIGGYNRLSVEAFDGAAELVGDTVEFDMLCRLLGRPDEKITWERVFDAAMMSGMDRVAFDTLSEGFEKVGFPQEDEPMKVNLLTPREIEDMLRAGNHGDDVLNNEFALFVYAPGKELEGSEPQTIMDMSTQLNPVRQRLRSLAPRLVQALEEYASGRQAMKEFYQGLAEDGLPSRQYATLFAIADQLLQRLVRPGDEQYKAACARLWRGGVELESKFEAPMYDTLKLTPENIVTDARRYLYT